MELYLKKIVKLSRPVEVIKEKIADGRSDGNCQNNIQQSCLEDTVCTEQFIKMEGLQGPKSNADTYKVGNDAHEGLLSDLQPVDHDTFLPDSKENLASAKPLGTGDSLVALILQTFKIHCAEWASALKFYR
jgi:hypothetical protein